MPLLVVALLAGSGFGPGREPSWEPRDSGSTARLRALIRRSSGQMQPAMRCGPVELDPRLARVTRDGVQIRLTSHEFRVLSYLMHNRARVVSQSELTEHIYAQDFDRDSNTVEVFIARLRRKLGSSIIETVRGLGYRVAP